MSGEMFIFGVIILCLVVFAAVCLWHAVDSLMDTRRALDGWEEAEKYWKETLGAWREDIDSHKSYEAVLRRELATLGARKQNEKLWGKYDADEFYVWCPEARIDKWRFDRRPESNWGKYLQREKEVRQHEAKTAE